MKNKFLLPAATALIGFSVAWVAKPSPAVTSAAVPATETPQPKSTHPTKSESRPTVGDGKRPKEVTAGDFPLADQAEKGPKTREEAKMLRLTEALGLTIDQQGEIIRLVEESHASATDTVPVIEDLATRGKAIEEALTKLLNPEQLAKFNELRVRERDNQIESRAQKALTTVIEEVDLSPQQREDVMARLRQSAKSELQSIPASATLLFDKSVLPTGKSELSVDGILLLAKIGEPLDASNPIAAHEKVLQTQRQELEEKLQCYDGILTSGQMGQYYAALAEQKAVMRTFPTRERPVVGDTTPPSEPAMIFEPDQDPE
ncbi:MAG: hypothetical protein ABIT37_23965 [Luteolibacter sp.]